MMLVHELTEPKKLTLLKFSSVLHVVALEVAEAVGLAVPHLALVPTIVSVLKAALSSALTIAPLPDVNIAVAELFATLPMLSSIHKVSRVDIARLLGQHTKAVPQASLPLALVLVTALQNLSAITLLDAVLQLAFVVVTRVLFKDLDEVGVLERLVPN